MGWPPIGGWNMGYRFAWSCSYRGTVDYKCYGLSDRFGGACQLELRHDANLFPADLYNGTADEYRRDIVASVGVLHFHNDSSRPMPAELVDAFNAWRMAEHAALVAKLRADPY